MAIVFITATPHAGRQQPLIAKPLNLRRSIRNVLTGFSGIVSSESCKSRLPICILTTRRVGILPPCGQKDLAACCSFLSARCGRGCRACYPLPPTPAGASEAPPAGGDSASYTVTLSHIGKINGLS